MHADISMPLPFRRHLFDGACSVSALQFLFEPVGERSAQQRLATFFSELHRVLTAEQMRDAHAQSLSGAATNSSATSITATGAAAAGIQFHPAMPQSHPQLALQAAKACMHLSSLWHMSTSDVGCPDGRCKVVRRRSCSISPTTRLHSAGSCTPLLLTQRCLQPAILVHHTARPKAATTSSLRAAPCACHIKVLACCRCANGR